MDGIPQPMGRWPDAGYRTYSRASVDTIFDASLPASPNWTGAFVVAQTEHYIIDTALITSQPSGEIIADKPFSAFNTGRGDGYFIENDPRTLQMTTTPWDAGITTIPKTAWRFTCPGAWARIS